ncbi:hypothetical protein B0H17DRAFT_1195586 [Mycena rosella]|uniref:Uncharacterized protein n=1 Tax=Mycena rosella TaxID=1033263 RepID=A0AAD7GQS3_MYCRO|nr:hypothetical protein B0H17DRAFT_1195586 [Mycena rosella]
MSTLPVCYGLAQETWDQICAEIILESPRRLCRLASASLILCFTVSDITWRDCFLAWFGTDDSLPLNEYRQLCFAFVHFFDTPRFAAARLLAKEFVYHPGINYPENEILTRITARVPSIRMDDMQAIMGYVAPLFKQAAESSNNKWNHIVQHFRSGLHGRYRQLYRIGSRPCALPQQTSPIIFCVLLSTVTSSQPAKARVCFATTLPKYKNLVDRLVSASSSHPITTTIPICLATMPEIRKQTPAKWLKRNFDKFDPAPEYPAGLARNNIGLEESPEKLRNATHLKKILDSGADQRDITLLFYHPAGDPMKSLEAWAELLKNLSGTSCFGYCFPVDLCTMYGWDTSLFGNDGLDYILAVYVQTLRRVNSWLLALIPRRSLEEIATGGNLVGWLTGRGLEMLEAQRLTAMVERSKDYRRCGAVYKGNNARIAGEALPMPFYS